MSEACIACDVLLKLASLTGGYFINKKHLSETILIEGYLRNIPLTLFRCWSMDFQSFRSGIYGKRVRSPTPGSGGAMVLGKLPVPGRPTIWMTAGQGPTAFAVGAGGGCLDIFSPICPISILSPSLWETGRYRLKYCLKGPLSPKQPTNKKPLLPALITLLAMLLTKSLKPKNLKFVTDHPLVFLYTRSPSIGFSKFS